MYKEIGDISIYNNEDDSIFIADPENMILLSPKEANSIMEFLMELFIKDSNSLESMNIK